MLSTEALQRTDKDSDRGCAHEAANHDGSAIAAVGCHAAGEVVGLGVHKAYSSARVSTFMDPNTSLGLLRCTWHCSVVFIVAAHNETEENATLPNDSCLGNV